MIQLHYDPGSASLIPHIVLAELGVPSHLGPYLQRMLARAAVQRVLAAEGMVSPFV
jgi:hypothetical protein